jgi:DNA-binding response OmpR family regulator
VLHILLVEDSAADVLLIRESLRTCPIAADVTIAYDGEEAQRLLSEPGFKAALILLDLNIPRFDGFSILERHRTEDGPPVVVFTGSANPADKARALDLGARDYVIKPLGKRSFVEAIHQILDRWGGHQLQSSNAVG